MNEVDYWEQFLNTGNVGDYLLFKNMQRAQQQPVNHEDIKTDAGNNQGYRDDIKG